MAMKISQPWDLFTKSKEKLHIFTQISIHKTNLCVPSLFRRRKVANVFDAVSKWGVFFVQGHGRNCHYMSNGISGMVQGNIALKHFHFLALRDKCYCELFARISQQIYTSYHWLSVMTILNSFRDRFGQ